MRHIPLYPDDASGADRPPLGPEPRIDPTCVIVDSHVGTWTDLMQYTTLWESTFDDYSYTAGHVDITYTDVGKFCSIASYVRINPGNHPMDRVTQHHCTYRREAYGFDTEDDTAFFDWRRAARCTVGHDVWIGHAATIMPGVRVGTGAVIGSNAVVTKDVEPYTIAIGVPAKPLRKRFDDDTVQKLLATQWWDWDRETLESRFNDLLDMPAFLRRYAP